MKYNVEFTIFAEEELNNIILFSFVHYKNKSFKIKLVNKIEKVIAYLETYPKMYPIIKEISNISYRKITFKKLIFIYFVDDKNKKVFITDVIHHKTFNT